MHKTGRLIHVLQGKNTMTELSSNQSKGENADDMQMSEEMGRGYANPSLVLAQLNMTLMSEMCS